MQTRRLTVYPGGFGDVFGSVWDGETWNDDGGAGSGRLQCVHPGGDDAIESVLLDVGGDRAARGRDLHGDGVLCWCQPSDQDRPGLSGG